MRDSQGGQTRATLLGRLRDDPADQTSWNEFVSHYEPVIRLWCRRWRIQEADAEDVTQNVMLQLSLKLPEFAYDRSRSFRGWLKTLTQNACRDFFRRLARMAAGSGDSAIRHLLESEPAQDDLLERLDKAFDLELLAMATEAVRARIEPQTWEAFRLTALEGLSGIEAAAQIPMPVNQVYVSKRRVQILLKEELARLDGGIAPDG